MLVSQQLQTAPCLYIPDSTAPQSAVLLLLDGRLFNGKAAEAEVKQLADATKGKHTEHDLIRHNLVVFKGGEGALQVGGQAEMVDVWCDATGV